MRSTNPVDGYSPIRKQPFSEGFQLFCMSEIYVATPGGQGGAFSRRINMSTVPVCRTEEKVAHQFIGNYNRASTKSGEKAD